MLKYPNHNANLVALRRIEGQVRGVQRMIKEGEYCVDILNQVHAIIYALARVEDKILERHFEGCVKSAVASGSSAEKEKKLSEILTIIRRFRKV
jgi:DNA-binding FrmR family transcriptional regulator